jgi:hypothetical protein
MELNEALIQLEDAIDCLYMQGFGAENNLDAEAIRVVRQALAKHYPNVSAKA